MLGLKLNHVSKRGYRSLWFILICRYRKNAAFRCWIKWAELLHVNLHEKDQTTKSLVSSSSNQIQNYMNVLENTSQSKQKRSRKNEIERNNCETYKHGNENVNLHSNSSLCIGMDRTNILSALTKLSFISHENLLRFVGIVLDGPERCVVTNEIGRGSLNELLESEVDLTLDFKISLLLDIVRGMHYLHHSALEHHGRLTSKCCFLDSKFTCKIGHYWSNALSNPVYCATNVTDTEDKLWMAPEVLRSKTANNNSDLYSFGIIMQEVLLRSKPYAANDPYVEPSKIVELVSATDGKSFRPSLPGFQAEWTDLAERCWHDQPHLRPSFASVRRSLIILNGGKNINVVESMLNRMEVHTRNLEDIVEQRSFELVAEKSRAETLICELLPRSVFDQLKTGTQIEPEHFDKVTIFSSDIEGFTKIAACATPMGIVTLLNNLYMLFDNVLIKYDVYKVATIGDAYIVASGLPIRNGDRHAAELAAMALEMIESIKGFEIPHIPGSFLNMRVGLHSGPCVAAVVGVKMPRYLLFGETVNTGALVEASGEAMKVHMSHTTAEILKGDGRFLMEPREEKVDIPGYGMVQTSWLNRIIGNDGTNSLLSAW